MSQKKEFINALQLIENWRRESPNDIAILTKKKGYTFDQLDNLSNQLCNYLNSLKIKKGSFVGCCIKNSPELIFCILGIMKAGLVYLPIEPTYPRDRIQYMIEDSNPKIILTKNEFSSLFSNFSGILVDLDKEKTKIDQATCTKQSSVSLKKESLAYVVYTSGSTGTPKGIVVNHQALAHASIAHQQYYPDRMIGLLTSSICFDVNLLIIFHLLCSGGTIVIPDEDELKDTSKVVKLITDFSIEYLLCVPSIYSLILEKEIELPSLKVVGLTGENIPRKILLLHGKFASNSILYNEYGPSEYAIGTSISKIYDPKTKELHDISIGKPLPDTEIYILDEELSLLPNNSKGEICITGKGLSNGYLNKDHLTSSKFVIYNKKLIYRSGDYGCLLDNGTYLFLGRMDNQVKIKGNRVELSEIERALYSHPSINEGVVVVKENKSGQNYLVGYYSCIKSNLVELELKKYLLEKLPTYMIPSLLIKIDKFPRTQNGKIDRKNLIHRKQNINTIFSEETNNTEITLINIWETLLPEVNIENDSNFFDLGGDSLGIAKMQIQINKKFFVDISVSEILQYPTLKKLACFIESLKEQNSKSETREIAKKKGKIFRKKKNGK